MLTWVVGAGGLLGRAVSRRSSATFIGSPVPWEDPTAATKVLESDLARFAFHVGRRDWSVVWAAGAGVVASSRTELRAETEILERFVLALRDQRPTGNGALFLASSAGGVYAGSSGPPFTESTLPHPLSDYGEAKLGQEELVGRILGGATAVVIGRLSNLFGPGQRLDKPQGLVSHLCLAAATRRPLSLFVPMDTSRDYLYVDDAASLVAALVTAAVEEQPDQPEVRNLASGQPISIACVVRTVQVVAHRRVGIALGNAPTSGRHVRDLRIGATLPDHLARLVTTPLPVGVKRVYEHTLTTLRERPDELFHLTELADPMRASTASRTGHRP